MNITQLLMTKKSWDIKSIRSDLTAQEVAELLIKYKVGALVVTGDANKMVGIVSERDLIGIVANPDLNAAEVPVSDLMTRSVIFCSPDDEVSFVLHQMNKHFIRHMPVLEKEELLGVLSIRELTKAYELLQIEANTDPLTQVSNRRPFLKTLEEEFEKARVHQQPMAVAMLDIDHFKTVNDTYGHDAGDRALRAFSELLIREFRTIDLVGRLGGEEFAVVFPETSLEGAQIACERLLKSTQALEVETEQSTVTFTVSIGLAFAFEENMPDAASLLKRADELLYDAKNSGRNRVVTSFPKPLRAVSAQ